MIILRPIEQKLAAGWSQSPSLGYNIGVLDQQQSLRRSRICAAPSSRSQKRLRATASFTVLEIDAKSGGGRPKLYHIGAFQPEDHLTIPFSPVGSEGRNMVKKGVAGGPEVFPTVAFRFRRSTDIAIGHGML